MNDPRKLFLLASGFLLAGAAVWWSSRAQAAVPGEDDGSDLLGFDALPSVSFDLGSLSSLTGDSAPDIGPGIDLGDLYSEGANAVNSILQSAPAGNPSALSAQGLQMLTGLETFSATPRPDAGAMQIGYGHDILPDESYTSITQDQAAQLLANDLAEKYVPAVVSAVKVSLTQNQFDALVIFCYNVGVSGFRGSTLLRLINAGDFAGAAAQFGRWIYAKGVQSAGLVNRRAKEASLFTAGTYA